MTGKEEFVCAEKPQSIGSISLAEQKGLPSWFRVAQQLHRLPAWARYVLATVIVLFTLLLLHAFLPATSEYRFIFFLPAVLLSSLFLAKGTGLWAVILSAISIRLVLPPLPLPAFLQDQQDLLAFALFLGIGLVSALTGEMVHNAFFRLAEANAKLGEAHARIEASEHEKDLLLHELTHRFRNDLANLDALLRLQARSARDPLTRSELTLASNRVQVVSRVQHLLGRSGEAAVIDLRPFILELCEDLRQSLIGERHIALKAESADLQLRSARAVIVGLVMNELVTNAVKYAFPDSRTGTILVQITRRGSACHLVVADDGIGQSQLAGQGSGLGQRLIQSMAQQLAGTFNVEVTDGGRISTMDFPLGEDIPG